MVEMADAMEDAEMIKDGGVMVGVDNHPNKDGIRRNRRNQAAEVPMGRLTRGTLLVGLTLGQRDPSLVAMTTIAATIRSQQMEKLSAMLIKKGRRSYLLRLFRHLRLIDESGASGGGAWPRTRRRSARRSARA